MRMQENLVTESLRDASCWKRSRLRIIAVTVRTFRNCYHDQLTCVFGHPLASLLETTDWAGGASSVSAEDYALNDRVGHLLFGERTENVPFQENAEKEIYKDGYGRRFKGGQEKISSSIDLDFQKGVEDILRL